jgi:hypothetical protein
MSLILSFNVLTIKLFLFISIAFLVSFLSPIYGTTIIIIISLITLFLPKFLLLPMMKLFSSKRLIFRIPKSSIYCGKRGSSPKKLIALTFDDIPYHEDCISFNQIVSCLNKYGLFFILM